ncbi:hepcidin-1 [Takifugu rubripes]|uniref:Hepcidin n=2 Tax=Takifugu TaxID=31032 RepID=A0A3B5K9Z8_TAKRU|nr:hepcidin [Takifugu rubripes]XP_029695293.1 hepcidin-like [Takifugu rubripes]XP_056900824.1 hepcidin-1 [Takifugu flavidus]TWW80107.1 Hepcidin Precursor [Takifugu flavidus]|eukprot:XP_003965681.1 PREDICTED: hepcidin [Takifugu rubripes]
MKASSIAVAVTLVLAFICILGSSASPFTRVQELEEAESKDTPVVAHQEMSMDSWMMPNHSRQKRQSHLSLCTLCCNCCKGNKGCGFCCRF